MSTVKKFFSPLRESLKKPCLQAMKLTTCGIIFAAASGCTITDVTSSTSSTLDAVTPDITLNRFVDVRLATIKKEAAVGYGENLDALAEMMGKEDKIAFGAWMRLNYSTLFDDLEKSADLVARIEETLPHT